MMRRSVARWESGSAPGAESGETENTRSMTLSGPRNYWTTGERPRAREAERARGRRWLLDGVGVVAALVLITGAIFYFRTHQEKEALIDRAAAELRRVELEMKYRAAAKLPGLNEDGWPEVIEEGWFQGPSGVPRNPLVSPERPWVDLATREEADLDNPMVKMTADPRLAGFWYNPHLGVVRARVPVMVSDVESLELYNRVNGTRLASIFGATSMPMESEQVVVVEPEHGAGRDTIEITPTGQVRRRSKD
jgi:hypothetical protein